MENDLLFLGRAGAVTLVNLAEDDDGGKAGLGILGNGRVEEGDACSLLSEGWARRECGTTAFTHVSLSGCLGAHISMAFLNKHAEGVDIGLIEDERKYRVDIYMTALSTKE